MNIEEARKVLWLKNNQRPLGELLDEGCLTKENLKWAAERAYNPNLREAARVLLEAKSDPTPAAKKTLTTPVVHEKEAGLEVGMSLREARSMLWPFSSHKDQPMGELIDSKQLSFRDLGYAIENAWNPKVRQAAITLALVKLNQVLREPAPPAGFVHVVSGGRSYSERRESFLTLIQGMILGFLIAFMIYLMAVFFRSAGKASPNAGSLAELVSTPAGIFALVFVLGTAVFASWLINYATDKITKRLDQQIEEYRRGQEGEDNVVQTVVQALDGNWHLFRNIQLPGRSKGDLDLVLVGPPGVWALEVKNFSGEYRNIGETWRYKHGRNWKTLAKSPSRQAKNNAARLSGFLEANKLKVFVKPAVVWANYKNVPFLESQSVAVWHINQLADELGNIWQGEKLSRLEQDKIVEKLTKVCDRQKKSK